MRYLADILTFLRFVLCGVLIFLALSGGALWAGFLTFVLAELTDAFDGTCASRWPFPKGRVPRYRKYAAKYDMVADALLLASMMLFFILRVNMIAGVVMGVICLVVAAVVEIIVYGKFFGHPDDAKAWALAARNFPRAKKIVMVRRYYYLAMLATVAVWTLIGSEWGVAVKWGLVGAMVVVAGFLWFFLKQRRQHISRDAVELEKKLAKKK